MKRLLGGGALIIAVFGFANFFISMRTPTPIPIIVSHPLAMLAMGYLLFQYIFPRMLYATTSQNYAEAIQQLRSTGNEIASGWCGGRIGLLYFRGPLIGVHVFPGGILIQPIFLPNVPILCEEIITVQEVSEVLTSIIEIKHISNRIKTPLKLRLNKNSAIGKALFQLKPPIKQ